MLIVFILSIYMVIDRDAIMAFLFRLVPPAYAEEARLLQTSVARSFGGFLRGQALMGFVYFADRARDERRCSASTLDGADVDGVRPADGDPVLRAVPAVGAAGGLGAHLQARGARCRRSSLMGIGWIVVMNVLQPRIMQGAVGIHPIVVLGSVLIGSRIAGIPGAIFGIPIAAVLSRVLLPLPPPIRGRPRRWPGARPSA